MNTLLKLALMLVTAFDCITTKFSTGNSAVVYGYRGGKLRIPLSLAKMIVENINPSGIHSSLNSLNLDGGYVCNTIEKTIRQMSYKDRIYLHFIDDMACESAAMTFVGNIIINVPDESLIAFANERGKTAGFKTSHAIFALAHEAAALSGRELSMAG
jgi:hypothetical protein